VVVATEGAAIVVDTEVANSTRISLHKGAKTSMEVVVVDTSVLHKINTMEVAGEEIIIGSKMEETFSSRHHSI
jgi:hypothetical protein